MTRRSLTALGLPVLAALTFAVAACGGGDDGGSEVTIPAGALVVGAEPGLRLDKSEYTATATNGNVVIAYQQNDTQRHTLVVRDSAGVIIGEKLEVVKRGEVDVATYALPAGTYELFCDVPGHGTMKASLTVS